MWQPYQCSECGQSFENACDPMMHMRIHSGEKTHKCISVTTISMQWVWVELWKCLWPYDAYESSQWRKTTQMHKCDNHINAVSMDRTLKMLVTLWCIWEFTVEKNTQMRKWDNHINAVSVCRALKIFVTLRCFTFTIYNCQSKI